MELVPQKRLLLFAGRGHPGLSGEIAGSLGVPLSTVHLSTFANGEIYCRYDESIRGADVFILQTHCDPINDRIMEQLNMIDAAKRASARRITAVPLLADYTARQIAGEEVTVVAPDAGGGKLAKRFANCLDTHGIDAELAFIDKRRPKGTHNVAVATEVVGAVQGRTCVLIDDMIDTGGTLTSASELLVERGADSVIIAATHPLLSGPAVDRLKNAPVREVVVTNTLPISDDKHFDSLTVLSIAAIMAEALRAVFGDTSVSEIFQGDNL
jgi:ribose-phosphate pyrophosphokinase